jgi:hypothetical protein
VAVPHPSENAGGGSLAPRSRLDRQDVAAANADHQSLPRGVVDLAAWRWRAWPGWWGAYYIATWSVAERSRRAS